MKYLAFLLLPCLVWADVEPVTPSVKKSVEKTTPAAQTAPAVFTPKAGEVALHLKPSEQSPVVMSLPLSELVSSSQDTGIVEGGKRWMSIEKPVTLTGFVERNAIDKNLDVAAGTVVWSSAEKTGELTVVDNPASVRLLEVEKMGKVEVKEPRVLYYTVPGQGNVNAAPKTDKNDERWQAQNDKRKGEAVSSTKAESERAIEGVMRRGGSLLGRSFYLEDSQGKRICKISKNSPISPLVLDQYIGRSAVFVGTLNENTGELVFTVNAIRLR